MEICIDFRVNRYSIDSTYMDNAARLDEIVSALTRMRLDSTRSVVQVSFTGVSSPEGNYEVNRRLADQRLKALEDYVRARISLPDSIVVEYRDSYIPWSYLTAEVETSDIPRRDEVLSILRSESHLVPYQNGTTIDSRIPTLQRLDGGNVWRTLNARFFSKMRNACAVFLTVKDEPVAVPEPVVESEPVVEAEPEDTVTVMEPVPVPQPMPQPEYRSLYLKSNAVGWGMLIANIAVEMDVAEHWSVTIPYYYSALNYFISTVKFRTSCLQPEVRYWLDGDNEGWFGGAHLGLAWYNYAKGGEWRYQDHDRRTPLFGGGISGGYRKPIDRNRKWWIEFSLGVGTYGLHYDVFRNEPNGRLVDTRKRTFFGIDQAAVSFAYRLDIRKKGGKR